MELYDFSPSPLTSIMEAPGSPEGPPRQRRTSSPWTKHKGPLRHAKRQAEREANDEKGDVAVERLATSIAHWLRAQPNCSADFSGAGLEPFFEANPRQRHYVQTTPGILACAIANSKIEVLQVRFDKRNPVTLLALIVLLLLSL